MGIERERSSLKTLTRPARGHGDDAEAAGIRTQRTAENPLQVRLIKGE